MKPVYGLLITTLFLVTISLPIMEAVHAQKTPEIRSPETILGSIRGKLPDTAIRELFINASEWDAAHQEVRDSSQAALIEQGAAVLPPLFKEYMSSTDVRRRITLDTVVQKIESPAIEYMLPYLQNKDPESRRHAAYLAGTVCVACLEKDRGKPGPFPGDKPLAKALHRALNKETDNPVLGALLVTLGKLRDPSRIPSISNHMKNKNEAVRLSAVIGLSQIPHIDAVRELLQAFSDPMGSIRQAALLGVSEPSMMRVGFQEVLDRAGNASPGSPVQLVYLESLHRFCQRLEKDALPLSSHEQEGIRELAKKLLKNSADSYLCRGYSVSLLAFLDAPSVKEQIAELRMHEIHPFVLGRIDQAEETLKQRKASKQSENGKQK